MPVKKTEKMPESTEITTKTKETKATIVKETKAPVAKETKAKEVIEVKEVKDTAKITPKITKNTKPTEVIEKKVLEEKKVIDDDEEDSDEDDEDEDDDEEEGDEKKMKEKKSKEKKSFAELATEFEKISDDIKTVETEIREAEKEMKAKEKRKLDLERQRGKIFAQFHKSHDDDVKKALKEKPKRKGNKDGGFNKELPVPPKLIKFLGLEAGVMMSRPRVMSAINDKFKSEGLKQGQTTTLDAKNATLLGKEKGRVIEFTGFQSFLKEFYEEAFPVVPTTTVNLS